MKLILAVAENPILSNSLLESGFSGASISGPFEEKEISTRRSPPCNRLRGKGLHRNECIHWTGKRLSEFF